MYQHSHVTYWESGLCAGKRNYKRGNQNWQYIQNIFPKRQIASNTSWPRHRREENL